MSENNTDLNLPDEKAALLARAKMMGVTVSNNASVDTIRKKIDEHMAAVDAQAAGAVAGSGEDATAADFPGAPPAPSGAGVDTSPTAAPQVAPAVSMDSPIVAKPKTWREQYRLDKMKMIRIRVQNMDPKDKGLTGEIFTVANGVLGTISKHVPYADEAEDGWHVPQALLDVIRSKEFLSITTVKDKSNGQLKVIQRMVRKYAVEVLPPLTQQELNRLKTAQAAAGASAM